MQNTSIMLEHVLVYIIVMAFHPGLLWKTYNYVRHLLCCLKEWKSQLLRKYHREHSYSLKVGRGAASLERLRIIDTINDDGSYNSCINQAHKNLICWIYYMKPEKELMIFIFNHHWDCRGRQWFGLLYTQAIAYVLMIWWRKGPAHQFPCLDLVHWVISVSTP